VMSLSRLSRSLSVGSLMSPSYPPALSFEPPRAGVAELADAAQCGSANALAR
jgi:hypothetical protein